MKPFILPIVLGLAFVGCNRDNDQSGTDTPILPIKIVQGNEVIELRYNGDKIAELREGVGAEATKSLFQYNGDLISTITNYNANTNVETSKQTFTYDSNARLVQVVVQENGTNETDIFTYTYNNNGTITQLENGRTPATITITNGNYTREINGGRIYNYKYDDKNNPYKNIKGFAAILPFAEKGANLNNVVEETYSNFMENYKVTYTYKYNTHNYPIERTRTHNGNTQTAVYTYNK